MLRKVLAAAVASLLADLDFRTPLASWKTGFEGFSSPNATDEWLLQSYGVNYANNVGTETLGNDTGMTDQICSVVHDGTAYGNRKAWESDATVLNGDSLVASGTSAGDSNAQDFCFRMVFRNHIPFALNDTLLAKREAVPYLGWGLYGNSTDKLHFLVDDGPTSVQVITTSGGFSDGALHYVTGWYDYSANIIYIKADISAEASISTAAVTGSLTNTAPLCINTRTNATLTEGAPGMQVTYMGVCVGANAQAMYDEDFWQHGADPTALLTTISRNSAISVPLAAGYVGHFSGGTTPANGCQLPIGYHSALAAGAGGLGLYCNSAVVNLSLKSEDIAGWTPSTCTAVNNVGDAPDGFRSAASVTPGVNNGFMYFNTGNMVASTKYTMSVWVKRNGGSDVAGKIILRDTTDAIQTEQAFTATDTWQRIDVQNTCGATGGAHVGRNYIYVDISGESILAWGCQTELGDGAGAYIRTAGAQASLVASTYEAAGSYIDNEVGEMECAFLVTKSGGSLNYAMTVDGTTNLKIIYANGTPTAVGALYGDSVFEDSCVGLQNVLVEESVCRFMWDVPGGSLGFESQLVSNGVTKDGTALPYEQTHSAGFQGIAIGSPGSGGGSQSLDGFVAYARSYDAPNGAAP